MPDTDQLTIITPLSGHTDAAGFLARCVLADGTELGLVPQLFGTLLTSGRPGAGWDGFDVGWMYLDPHAAAAAYALLAAGSAAEPAGWVRRCARGQPTVRRRACPRCGRVLERVDDAPYPACTHGAGAAP